ncbi:MAG TPA: IS5 family transposase [Dehalococcoidia bacterium]|nr:IS5 family transposase [Dehalococcoidia bacterium]
MMTVSFASLAYENKKKKTRREKFLEEMDEVIPWDELLQIIKQYYPRAGNGRQPMPLERMMRIYFMQQWYGLSDPAMEDALYDIESIRRFAGIDLGVDVIPDETTILHFRHLLEKHQLTQKIFEKAQQYLTEKGLLLREGTIVDATIISAPSSTKNQDKTRDKEMKQTKKGNQWYFGMKAHVGTDTRKGLAHSVVVTDASVHDSQVMDELIHGEEQAVYGDRAYTSEKKKQEYEARGIKWCINRKACRHYQLTPEDVTYNHNQSQIRAKGEHAFLVVKHLWHYQKVRYKGLFKNAVQIFSLFALANFYLVRHELQAIRA